MSRIYKKISMIFLLPYFLAEFFAKNTGKEYKVSFWNKIILFFKFRRNIKKLSPASSFLEHIKMATTILNIPKSTEGSVVECGVYKGGSAVNLSLVCSLCNRKLELFDSFVGLPEPTKEDLSHVIVNTKEVYFYSKGAYKGTLEQVKKNIEKFGNINVCNFNVGYFEKTLPNFKSKCVFVFEDADLKESVKDCLKNLWPLMQDGSYFYTHEAQHLDIAALFFDKEWWNKNLNLIPLGLVGAGNGLGIGMEKFEFGSALGYAVKNPNILNFNKKLEIDNKDKLQNPIISIITPTYNRGKFLEKCILSIKNQDYKNIEHIVIDGGSTDNSLDILKKYEGTYNLKWISEKDKGCADAMNKGFNRATGDIFCWLDSDDYYLPGTLFKIVKIFQEKPNVDVVFGDNLIANSEGKIVDYIRNTNFDTNVQLYITMSLGGLATFWKKSVSDKIGLFDNNYSRIGDAEFFVKMGLSGAKFYHTRDFLAVAVKHEKQISSASEIVKKENQKMLEKYADKKKIENKWFKTKIIAKRTFNYVKQGDVFYVLRGIYRRIKLIFNGTEK